jgi:hypothetical protein
MMVAMDRAIAWRAALLQALLIAAVAVALAVALAGPGAWGACALVAAAVLRLPYMSVLAGAALSGLLMLPGVLIGAHWLGAPLGLAAFGAWCGWLAGRRIRTAV